MSREDKRPTQRDPFSGRRVIASDSPTSGGSLLIRASLASPSTAAVDPGADRDGPRRLVTAQGQRPHRADAAPTTLFGKPVDVTADAASKPTVGNVFSRVGGISAGAFGSAQRSQESLGRDLSGQGQAGQNVRAMQATGEEWVAVW